MVEIQIQDKKYEIPTEGKDITLEWWCGLYTIIKKHTKMEVEEEKKEIKEKIMIFFKPCSIFVQMIIQ